MKNPLCCCARDGLRWCALCLVLAASTGASLGESVVPDPTQTPAYLQLHRDVLINADLWDDQPRILAAGYGFEGIQGIPGLLTAADLQAAVDAGAGVNLDWAALDPMPPLRNLTSGASPLGIAVAGFGGLPLFADAMPIEFSWPLLPSTVSATDIAIHLNTGELVAPLVAALNPNYDHNERHVIVVFGEFGNRLAPGEPGAIYPESIEIVADATPLMAVGPQGPVPIVGLTASSSNPYVAGPSLVGAKLSRFSPVGDFPPAALANAFPNDAFALYGSAAQYRLRLFTSGGFSPDGVSGLLPDDFERFFRLHAIDASGVPVLISQAGLRYELGDGGLEVLGLAEVGAPTEGPADRAYYVEDHDNYFDIVLSGDASAMARLVAVEIPTSAEPGYLDLYNPGGPGRTPDPGTRYTKPALPELEPISIALHGQETVSYAAQDLASYDLDDDLAVVFRLRDPAGPDRFTSSSITAQDWVDQGLFVIGVDFANESSRPGVSDVWAFSNAESGDRIYTLDPDLQAALSSPGSGWVDEGRAFGAFAEPQPGAVPVYRFIQRRTGWSYYSADRRGGERLEARAAQAPGSAIMQTQYFEPHRLGEPRINELSGVAFAGVAWYSADLRPDVNACQTPSRRRPC